MKKLFNYLLFKWKFRKHRQMDSQLESFLRQLMDNGSVDIVYMGLPIKVFVTPTVREKGISNVK